MTPITIKLLTRENESKDEIIDVKSILNGEPEKKINPETKIFETPKIIKSKR
jgi:hypothetical protein